MKVVALLPMKGHSERVPNKNLKLFNGKPLFHHVLSTLLDCSVIDEVVINTDSESIKLSAAPFGKRVKFVDRPLDLVGDYVSMNKIIHHDLSVTDGDIYLQTHSTNPLLKSTTVQNAIEQMLLFVENRSHDSIFSVTRLQTRLYDVEGNAINHNPQELKRTQDLPPLFEENSNFYIFTKESFQNAGGKRIGRSPFMFVTDKLESCDIDEPEDFALAEALYKTLRS